jgi:predicted RNase H-like HicB family nuclease
MSKQCQTTMERDTQKPNYPLTAVFVKDKEDGGYTGFIMEVPGVVAEGDTKQEVEANLFECLGAMLRFNKDEREIQRLTHGEDDDDYETETFNFELSL